MVLTERIKKDLKSEIDSDERIPTDKKQVTFDYISEFIKDSPSDLFEITSVHKMVNALFVLPFTMDSCVDNLKWFDREF